MSTLDTFAAEAVDKATQRLAERLQAAMPDAIVTGDVGEVTVQGRGLARRLWVEPALRWPAGLVR